MFDSPPFPPPLGHLTGISRSRILNLRRRVALGLTLSDDEPIRATFSGKVVEADEVFERLNNQARRDLGPDKAPSERRYF